MKRFLAHKFGVNHGARYKTQSQAKLLSAGISLAMLASCSVNKPSTTPLGTVVRGELTQRVSFSGNITPNRKSIITAPYSGYVRNIYVHMGETVREGAPIVSMAQSLKESGTEIFPLRAPFTGTVVQVLKKQGEYADPQNTQGGNALVRIDDLTQLFVEAAAPEVEILKLVVGQEAVIRATAIPGKTYRGKIQQISQASIEQRDWDRARVEFPVSIQILDRDVQLKPGMSVVVDILTLKLSKVLLLPHEFIQKKGGQFFVKSEKGEKKEIEVGAQNEEVFEILKGLNEGEKVQQTDFLTLIQSE
ncbi:MAG: efflux RND transporter periplasmic adaptor subunit [Bdellovibrionia bacterium]